MPRNDHTYTEVLGFRKKADAPVGDGRRPTVVSAEAPEGPELLLEPSNHPAVGPFKAALVSDGIPALALSVGDVAAEWQRLVDRGVRFVQGPVAAGEVTVAILDDTCGNLVQLVGPAS